MIFSGFVALLSWSIFLPSFYLLGSLFASLVGEGDLRMRGILYVALGLGLFLYFLIVISVVGMLKPLPVLIFFGFVLASRWKTLPEFKAWLISLWKLVMGPQRGALLACRIIFLISAALSAVMCFLPEISNDSLCYQLAVPKLFTRYGSTHPIYYDFNSYMPFMMNYFYAVGLLFLNVTIAKLFNWCIGFFFFLSLFLVILKITRDEHITYLCSLMVWLTPTVFKETTMTYVDVAVGFFSFLALYALVEAENRSKRSMFFLSGMLYGLALSVKYIALNAGLGFAVIFFYSILKNENKILLLQGLCLFVVGVLAGGGYWYMRNVFLTGNPVFPHFGSFFNAEVFNLVYANKTIGMPKTIWNFLLLPWNTVLYPDRFDRFFWIGPFYLLASPFALCGIMAGSKARQHFAFAFCYTLSWFFMGQNVRYFIPAFPAFAVASACGFEASKKWILPRAMRYSTQFIGIVLLCFLLSIGLYHFRYHYRALLGIWSLDTYLTNMERSYPISKWINSNLPEGAKILITGEVRRFYIDRDNLRESFVSERSELRTLEGGQAAMNFLKALKVTHILFARNSNRSVEEAFKRLPQALADAVRDPHLMKQIVTMQSQNVREEQYVYSVYELAEEVEEESEI